MSALPRWCDQAACRGAGSDLFFSEDLRTQERAKAVCQGCPARTACLLDALERREEHGVWGGRTPKEREKLLRQILGADRRRYEVTSQALDGRPCSRCGKAPARDAGKHLCHACADAGAEKTGSRSVLRAAVST